MDESNENVDKNKTNPLDLDTNKPEVSNLTVLTPEYICKLTYYILVCSHLLKLFNNLHII